MRYLPYLMLIFMLAPIAIWIIIDMAVLNGSTTRFNGEQNYVLITLVPLVIIAFAILMKWSSNHIQKSLDK